MSIYNSGINNLSIFYQGNFITTGYLNNRLIFNGNLVTLTIEPSEQDAVVQFTTDGAKQINDNSITVKKGTIVNYTVSKEGFRTVEDSITLQDNTTLNVELLLDQVLNVKDYNYTVDTVNNLINVTLTEYVGTDTNVVIPQIEMR